MQFKLDLLALAISHASPDMLKFLVDKSDIEKTSLAKVSAKAECVYVQLAVDVDIFAHLFVRLSSEVP
jgi:hypothetical protein